MRGIHILICFLFVSVSCIFAVSPKSPHGANHKIDCATCHVTDDWNKIKENGFNHNKTQFPLTGQHKAVNCRSCHTTLKFEDAQTECVSCHNDMHEGTTGRDCNRCHTTNSWIVTNVRQIHQQQGFPLLGAHAVTDCNRCHTSASTLRFENVRTDCIGCHQANYDYTSAPNHRQAGFSTDCAQCHKMSRGGHNIECLSCHAEGYLNTSPDCYSCHKWDYDNTTNPSHKASNFSTECKSCHSINSWQPATFDHDKLYFPIYSGTHQGEWNSCTDCHKNASNYAQFTCTDCHEHNKPDMDDKHDDVRNYVYNSTNCYSCHPRGKAD